MHFLSQFLVRERGKSQKYIFVIASLMKIWSQHLSSGPSCDDFNQPLDTQFFLKTRKKTFQIFLQLTKKLGINNLSTLLRNMTNTISNNLRLAGNTFCKKTQLNLYSSHSFPGVVMKYFIYSSVSKILFDKLFLVHLSCPRPVLNHCPINEAEQKELDEKKLSPSPKK